MADLLAGLGAIPQEPLAREQLRQLEALHGGGKGLRATACTSPSARRNHGGYGRHDQAIDPAPSGPGGVREARGGALPVAAKGPCTRWSACWKGTRHHGRAEKVLLEQLRHPVNGQQRYWLTLRLHELYHNALVQRRRGVARRAARSCTRRSSASSAPTWDARPQPPPRADQPALRLLRHRPRQEAGRRRATTCGPSPQAAARDAQPAERQLPEHRQPASPRRSTT